MVCEKKSLKNLKELYSKYWKKRGGIASTRLSQTVPQLSTFVMALGILCALTCTKMHAKPHQLWEQRTEKPISVHSKYLFPALLMFRMSSRITFTNEAFVNNIVILQKTNRACSSSFWQCLAAITNSTRDIQSTNSLNKCRNQLRRDTHISNSLWWIIPPGSFPCRSAGSCESREERWRWREQVFYYPLMIHTERWIADVVITEAVSTDESLIRTRGATWLQVYLSASWREMQGWPTLGGSSAKQKKSRVSLMMMLMRKAGKSATGQMGEVKGDERRGEECWRLLVCTFISSSTRSLSPALSSEHSVWLPPEKKVFLSPSLYTYY